MNEKPYFSLIIPSFERPKQLKRCLNAVAGIDYPKENFEVIVVDDGSKSPPEELVKSFSDRLEIRLIKQSNTGPGGARNTGAKNAKGKYLAFTDDDCEPDPTWLKEYEKAFKKYPDNFLGGKTVNALGDNPYSSASELLVGYLYSYHNAEPENAIFFNSSNIAIPKEAFFESGGFDVTTIKDTAEDRELCVRWQFQGRKLTYIDKAIVYHSHELSLISLWTQHFNYGKGAYYFDKTCALRGQRVAKTKSGRFYRGLISYPYKKRVQNMYFISLLLILTQVSYGFGYFWERAVRAVNST